MSKTPGDDSAAYQSYAVIHFGRSQLVRNICHIADLVLVSYTISSSYVGSVATQAAFVTVNCRQESNDFHFNIMNNNTKWLRREKKSLFNMTVISL